MPFGVTEYEGFFASRVWGVHWSTHRPGSGYWSCGTLTVTVRTDRLPEASMASTVMV
jgi:hypothetical protein